MSTKATSINICIFTWQRTNNDAGDDLYPGGYEQWPEPEQSVGRVIANALAQLQFEGTSLPLDFWGMCSLSDSAVAVQNQNAVISNGLNPQRLPAVQMWAEYDDGTSGYYLLGDSVKTDIVAPITVENVSDRLKALLTKSEQDDNSNSLLCKFVPQACTWSAWIWLAAMGLTAYKTYDAWKRPVEATGWLAGFLFSANEFVARGGIKALKK